MSIGLTENDYIRFKHLLEYFVAHLEYIREYKDNTRGYNEYIKPILENFKRTGQGYKGFEIQNQISNWCEYKPYNRICITVRKDQYPNNGCYLHWEGTDINIIAKWNQEKTSIESLTIANIPKEVNENLNELGLYNNTVPNDNLINFFNTYIEAYSEKHSNTINKMEEYVNLLKSNHNLVLTGAPGTGKTYLAKQIAEKLTNTKYDDKENPQIKMVQFHPSYDYTDFVEGLRPKNDESGNIGFERKDGVFKEFCKKALKNLKDNQKTDKELKFEEQFDNTYKKFVKNVRENIENEETVKISLKTPNKWMIVERIHNNNLKLKAINNTTDTIHTVSYNRLKKLANKYRNLKDVEDMSNLSDEIIDTIGGCNASAYWGVLHEIYQKYWKENTSNVVSKVEKKNFVFIIDEINRGEISKIFGELFFSIDPGYRGEKGIIQTQYQNLLKDTANEDENTKDEDDFDDVFKDGFYVPENVYIIGTMNDIDRSVESMDFAMRRRFAWKEVTAESRIEMLDEMKPYINDDTIKEAKNRLRNLNAAISETEGLNSAYHIGPAYFLKLENYINDKDSMWENLWNNHIKGVLYEYLRGYENQKNILDKLEKAYKNKTEQQEEKTESNNNSDSTNKE